MPGNRVPRRGIACLSPHLDDAVLSCGGLLARAREQGWPVRIVTVFAGSSPPSELLTPFARELHRAWGDPPAPVATRRLEDELAAGVLDCVVTWWPYQDAIYRHPAYSSWESVIGTPVEENALEAELLDRCAALSEAVLLFPLAVGHHVDHQVVFRVGWSLGQGGRRVGFYEDLPYAAWEDGAEDRLAEISQTLYPQVIDCSAFWAAKTDAVSCYASQLAELSRDGLPITETLGRYAASLLPGGRAERVWWPQEGPWI